MMICVADHVPIAPPDNKDRVGYFELRRIHMLQGLQLLDILLVDHERAEPRHRLRSRCRVVRGLRSHGGCLVDRDLP